MKVVCDTNVLISGIVFGGNCRAILQMISTGRLNACMSATLLAELDDVLRRPKFGMDSHEVTATLELVQHTFDWISPSEKLSVIDDDPDDNAVLEAAIEYRAQKIVSGDDHLLALKSFRGIPILSPAAFLSSLC